MNKTELIKAIAEKCEMPQTQVGTVLNTFIEVVTETVKSEDIVKLPSFGTFRCKVSSEHSVKNPVTKETYTVPARRKLAFTAGSITKNL